jgi:hypothetical protein
MTLCSPIQILTTANVAAKEKIEAYNFSVDNHLSGEHISTLNEYNNPSFATMFERALLKTYITTRFGLNPSHHQVL